jgi:tetratricopeptide (TPR) repeat protein
LRVIESQARVWHGEYELAERAAKEALSSQDPKTRLKAMSSLFEALGPAAKYQEIAQRMVEVSERPAEPELLNPWLDCLVNATAYLAAGGDREVRQRTLALLEESRERLEPLLVGRAETMKAHMARVSGKPAQALAYVRQAAEFYESIGNRRAACEALGNLGMALGETGQFELAEDCMRRLLATAQKMDLKFMIGGALLNLTYFLGYLGRLGEAKSVGEQALAATTTQGDRRFQGYAEAYLSRTEYLAGDYPAAERFARAAIATWERVPSPRPFGLALIARALVAQSRGAHTQFKSLGAVEEGESTIFLALAECLLAAGDQRAAKQILEETAKQVLAQAETIEDPAIRESFLTRFPEHRRIFELRGQLSLASD